MDTNEIEKLKLRVEMHKSNLLFRKQLMKEKEEWTLMYNEIQEIIGDLKKQYEQTGNDSDKETLDSWLKEEKAYINLLDEYTQDINKINIELNVYRDEDYRIELNFLDRLTRYNDNLKYIQDIENVSSKSLLNSNYKLSKGSRLYDEYGQEHYILSDFESTYTQLIYDQKQLSEYIKSSYNLIFNGVYEPPMIPDKVINNEIIPVHEEDMKLDNQFNDDDALNVQYSNLQNILNVGELSLEQEIDLLKRFQNNIVTKKKTGKKRYEIINGEKLEIPKKYSGYYHNANSWLKARIKLLNENDLKLKEKENETEEYIDINAYATYNDKNDIVPIENIRKPKDKKKLKTKFKAIGAIVAATIVAGSALVVTTVNNLKSKVNNGGKNIKVTETLEKETLATQDIDSVNDTIKDNEPKEKVVKPDNKIELGSVVTVKEGRSIYKSAGDAIEHENGKTPYYDYNSSNTVAGVALKSNDNIASFVLLPDQTDTYEVIINGKKIYMSSLEAKNKINDMKKRGYKAESIAVTNESADKGITGFYNILDVKGGKSR